jgi:hypothetical protein
MSLHLTMVTTKWFIYVAVIFNSPNGKDLMTTLQVVCAFNSHYHYPNLHDTYEKQTLVKSSVTW